MSDVKRYDWEEIASGYGGCIIEAGAGAYVRSSDYDALREENEYLVGRHSDLLTQGKEEFLKFQKLREENKELQIILKTEVAVNRATKASKDRIHWVDKTSGDTNHESP